MKSLLIKDTTVDERMDIVKEALKGFGDGECEGIDMDDMYDDYIYGRKAPRLLPEWPRLLHLRRLLSLPLFHQYHNRIHHGTV